MSRYLGLVCAVALSGCAATNSLRTKISSDPAETKDEKRVLIVEMRKAYLGCEDYNAARPIAASNGAVKKPAQSGDPVSSANCEAIQSDLANFRQVNYDVKLTDKENIQRARVLRFMDAGTTLSDVYCDEFFRSVNLSARKRQFGKGLSTDTSTLVAGVLNLVKAGSAALTASTVGFNAVNASFRNYDESFMVDADLAKMRRLVLAAQDSMKIQNEKAPPRTIFAAESKVIRYAGLCSFLGMKDLLNDSIATKTSDIEKASAAEQGKSDLPVVKAGAVTAAVKPDVSAGVGPDVQTRILPAATLDAPLSQPSPPG